jgi:hypothetical protein
VALPSGNMANFLRVRAYIVVVAGAWVGYNIAKLKINKWDGNGSKVYKSYSFIVCAPA